MNVVHCDVAMRNWSWSALSRAKRRNIVGWTSVFLVFVWGSIRPLLTPISESLFQAPWFTIACILFMFWPGYDKKSDKLLTGVPIYPENDDD